MAVLLRKLTLLNGVIFPWLATWMLALPLFHIHSLDPQESRSSAPPFLAHTVFSPDYPGEYGPRAAAAPDSSTENHGVFSHHDPRYSENELDFFGEEDDGKRKSGALSAPFLTSSSPDRPPLGVFRHALFEIKPPPFRLLAASRSTRAPPVSC